MTGMRPTRHPVPLGHRFRRHLEARRAAEEGGQDSGFTLVELLTAMLLTSVALVLVIPILLTVTNVTNDGTTSSNANAQARQALSSLNAYIGSTNSNNVCFPGTGQTGVSLTCPSGGSSGNTLRILTNAYGVCQWMQWTVTNNELTQQVWPTTWTQASGTPTALPIAGPVNTASSLGPVFSLNSSGLLVNIALTLQGTSSVSATSNTQPNSQPVTLQSAASLFTSTQPTGSC